MMPGYGNTGDSVYGHHLDFLNERVQETIDFISRYLMGLGQDGEVITSTDIEGLFYCAAFADSLEGTDPEDPKGFVAQMNMLDGNMPGLRDRTVFETARGRVSGALPHKAIEERKPRSQQADVLAEERKMKMESNREEWIKMNPELTKKILDIKDQEDRFNKMESTIQSIPEIVRVIVKEELNKREPRPSVTGEPSKSTAGTGQEVSVLPPLYLEYHVDTRYWKVDTDRKTGYPDISTSIVYPAETPAELSLSILLSDGESKAQVSSVEYRVRVANMEAYEVLYNRLKILLSEFLDADNEGDLITDLILKEPSERSLWIPVTKNGGKPLRTASVAEVEKLKGDATLEVKLGDSGLKTGISLEDHGNVTRLSEDLSRIIEMVLRTSEVTETKKEKS